MQGPVAGIADLDRDAFVWLNQLLHSADSPLVESIFRFMNELGNAWILILVALAVLLLTRTRALRHRALLDLTFTAGLALGIVRLLKITVGRSRPQRALRTLFKSGEVHSAFGEAGSRKSFPSGHTALVFALVVLFWIWCRRTQPPWKQRLMLGAGLLLALFAGLGRIYTGMHFPLDVFVGALIGMGSAVAGTLVARRMRRPLVATEQAARPSV